MPDTPMTAARLEEIRARAEAATPGPWFPKATDDHMHMNARLVVTGEPCALVHDNKVSFDDGMNCDSEKTICVTLLQAPDAVGHDSCLWDENTVFIAHARTDIPDLLAEVERLRDAEDSTARLFDALAEFIGVDDTEERFWKDLDTKDREAVLNAAKLKLAALRSTSSKDAGHD